MKTIAVYSTPPEDFAHTVVVSGCFCKVKNKILLIKRHESCPQPGKWSVPAGKSEAGEDTLTTCIRELREEVGIVLYPDTVFKLSDLYCRLGSLDYIFSMYHTDFQEEPLLQLSENEVCDARWVTTTEAKKLPLILGGLEAITFFEQKVL